MNPRAEFSHAVVPRDPGEESVPSVLGRPVVRGRPARRGGGPGRLANARDAARKAHVDLCAHAAASVLLPPQHPRVSGRSGDMILNGAYLVERDAAAEFATAVNALRRRESPNGFMLELSGPFAPYNFVTPRETG